MHFVRFVLSGKVQYRRRRSGGRRYRTDGTPASRFAQYFACLSAGVTSRDRPRLGKLDRLGLGYAVPAGTRSIRRSWSLCEERPN